MNQDNYTGSIIQLNNYPTDKYNVLIPVSTMQVMNNMQRIIVNEVKLDTTVDNNGSGRDIYKEKSSGKFAITKVGGMKLAAAANISIVDTESVLPEGCERCVSMARAIGKAKACGTCPAQYNVAVTVTIRVPEPSGGFRMMKATREIDCEAEKTTTTENQYKRFLPHRVAQAESKAFMRALRSALGLSATYDLSELKKPFIIAHVVANLDAPEIRDALAKNYLQSMGMLFEGSGTPRAAIESSRNSVPIEDVSSLGNSSDTNEPIREEDIPEDTNEPLPWEDPNDGSIRCEDCHNVIVETKNRYGKVWSPEAIRDYSMDKYKCCLCTACQDKRKGGNGA